MPSLAPLLRACAAFAALAIAARGEIALPGDTLPLDTLADFRKPAPNWTRAGGLDGDPRTEKILRPAAGTGVLVCNPAKEYHGEAGNLFTAWEHGDLELELDFLLTPGSNSGIYLQGRYEVQLYDSWGVAAPGFKDCGGIYARWDPARGKGSEAYDGRPPAANASRAPGLWQRLRIVFEAPRFDASGAKVRPARFVRVELNGFPVQENVELTGPTRGGVAEDERPLGPLMIQGDHGPVALRRIVAKRFGAGEVAVRDLRYRLYAGEFKTVGDYADRTPDAEGVAPEFSPSVTDRSGRLALVFTGALEVPRDGWYKFSVEGRGPAGLGIGGRPVVQPLDRGGEAGLVALTAGRHEFRTDWVNAAAGRPSFRVAVEGPGLAPRDLTAVPRAEAPAKPAAPPELPITLRPGERVLVQRGFVPFQPYKRLYAVSVGTPAGTHFAYDFETGALLRAWRGAFVDATSMWRDRGHNQEAVPTGPALTFAARPVVALLEFSRSSGWPERPEPLWRPLGYRLEPDGLPVFSAEIAGLKVEDRIAPADGGRSLERTIVVTGELPSWSAWVSLAEGERITPRPGGWVIGDREWYLDWPADAALQPILRTWNGRQQLAVLLTPRLLGTPIRSTLTW